MVAWSSRIARPEGVWRSVGRGFLVAVVVVGGEDCGRMDIIGMLVVLEVVDGLVYVECRC